MRPSDFRSTDDVQKRLRQEFKKHETNVIYTGGRRGGADDVIRRRRNLIPSDTVAQTLTAFHGDPRLAYNHKSQIWESDQSYSNVFNNQTHASHIMFVHTLHEAILHTKDSLTSQTNSGVQLTQSNKEKLIFLRLRGSVYVLMNAVGECMEIILGKPLTSRFLLHFEEGTELSEYEGLWNPIVQFCIAFNQKLRQPLLKSLKNVAETQAAIKDFGSMLDATLQMQGNRETFNAFAEKVSLAPWSIETHQQ